MHFLATPLLLACLGSPPPSAAPSVEEALVVYSAGFDVLFADERDRGLAGVLAALGDRIASQARERGEPELVLGSVLQEALRRPFCVRAGVTQGDPWFQVTVRCADSKAARSLATRARQLGGLDAEPSGPVGIPTPFGPLELGASEESFQIWLGSLQEEPFRFPDHGLPEGAQLAFFLRYDPLVATRFLERVVPPDELEPLSKVLAVLGLGGEGSARRLAIGRHAGQSLTVGRTQPYRGVREPLDERDFRRIPADATLARLIQCRPSGLLAWLDAIEAGTATAAERHVAELAGIRIGKDLLERLGPTVGVHLSRGSGGGSFLSAVLFAETPAPDELHAAIERGLRTAVARLREDGAERVAIRSFRHADTDCTSLVFPGLAVPVEPAFAVADGTLFLAAHPNALRGALDQLRAEDSILARPEVAAGLREESGACVGFAFVDAPYCLERGYALVSQGTLALQNLARSEPDLGAAMASLLPPQRALQRGVRPWIGWQRLRGETLVDEGRLDASVTTSLVVLAGTPLLGGFPIVAAVAIPKLLSARLAANEEAAIATLRGVVAAQRAFRAAQAVDSDLDGTGEYGFLAELTGATPLRILGERGPAPGSAPEDLLSPPFFAPDFAVADDGFGAGVATRQGYHFQIWLSGARVDGAWSATPEHALGGSGPSVATDPNGCERYYVCYAWPVQAGQTGNRVFAIRQDGELVVFANARPTYSGVPATGGRGPAGHAAYEREDLAAPFASGRRATDGNTWSRLDVDG